VVHLLGGPASELPLRTATDLSSAPRCRPASSPWTTRTRTAPSGASARRS